jgi:hypothetical protein
MSQLTKEWRFLRSGWIYAFVLTGKQAAATELVSKALKDVVERNDLVSSRRKRRLFFAMLFREGHKIPRSATTEDGSSPMLNRLHGIPEPGRSALALLHLRLFAPDQIAVIVDQTEKQLPDILKTARNDISKIVPATP